MADTGWKSPSVSLLVDTGEGGGWGNLDSAFSQNDTDMSLATVVFTTLKGPTIRYSGFGITNDDIPPNSVVTGIEIESDMYKDAANNVDVFVRVYDQTNKKSDELLSLNISAIGTSDTDTYQSFGGDGFLFGEEKYTLSEVFDSSFGMEVYLHDRDSFPQTEVFFDHIRLKVFYTLVTDSVSPDETTPVIVPSRLLPNNRTAGEKPVGPVEIDRSTIVGRNMQRLLLFQTRNDLESVTGREVWESGVEPDNQVENNQLSIGTGTKPAFSDTDPRFFSGIIDKSDFTITFRCASDVAPGAGVKGIFVVEPATPVQMQIEIYRGFISDFYTVTLESDDIGGGFSFTETTFIGDKKYHMFTVIFSGTTAYAIIDQFVSSPITVGANRPTATASPVAYLGGFNTQLDYRRYEFLSCHDEALSVEAVLAWHLDPYQFLRDVF